MSRYRQDMLLWPDGQPRVLNVDNRLEGEINGVPYRVEIRGDFATCSFIDRRGVQALTPRRMFQPHFNVLGVVIGCIEISEGRAFGADMMGLRPLPADGS